MWTNNSCGGCIPNVCSSWWRKVSALKYGELLTFTVPIESCILYTLRIVRCLLCRPTKNRVIKCKSHGAGPAVTAAWGTIFLCWCYPAWCVLNYAFWDPILLFTEVCIWHSILYAFGFSILNNRKNTEWGEIARCIGVRLHSLWLWSQLFNFTIDLICCEWFFLCFSMGNPPIGYLIWLLDEYMYFILISAW